MKKTIRMITGIMFMAFWGGSLYYGVSTGNDCFTRIGLFYAWLMFAYSLCAIPKSSRAEAVKNYEQKFAAHKVIFNTFTVCFALFLVYSGYIVTSCCFIFSGVILESIKRDGKKADEVK